LHSRPPVICLRIFILQGGELHGQRCERQVYGGGGGGGEQGNLLFITEPALILNLSMA
jgi:hypothetical protein